MRIAMDVPPTKLKSLQKDSVDSDKSMAFLSDGRSEADGLRIQAVRALLLALNHKINKVKCISSRGELPTRKSVNSVLLKCQDLLEETEAKYLKVYGIHLLHYGEGSLGDFLFEELQLPEFESTIANYRNDANKFGRIKRYISLILSVLDSLEGNSDAATISIEAMKAVKAKREWINKESNGSEWKQVDGGFGERPITAEPTSPRKARSAKKTKEAEEAEQANRRRWTPIQRQRILQRTGGKCYLCGGAFKEDEVWQADHVIAFSASAQFDVIGNMLPAHAKCNGSSGKWHHDLITATQEKNFEILSDVVDHSSLLPEVHQQLREARNLKKSLITRFDDGKIVQVARVDLTPLLEALENSFSIQSSEHSLVAGFEKLDLNSPVKNKPATPTKKTPKKSPLKTDVLSSPLTVGAIADDFEIPERSTNIGGYGTVFKALWKKGDQTVAIKTHKSDPEDDERTKRFRDSLKMEIEILRSIKGKNDSHIVSYLGHFKRGTEWFLVMEWLDGDLRNFVRRRQTMSDLLDVVIQIAEGLKFLHANSIMHRDVKSANIGIQNKEGRRRAKILDFGLATRFSESEFKSHQRGTIRFMAPEMRSGEPYTFKVDVYSFGMLLGELNPLATSQNDGQAIEKAMKTCRARNPDDRPTFVEILKDLYSHKP